MSFFSVNNISIATIANAAEITALLNLAYRGEASRTGWTTEANIIAGDQRTTINEVEDLMRKQGSTFLIYSNDKIEGCVNLQQQDRKLYLGMLSVHPQLQSSGIGKKLLAASVELALAKECSSIYMMVIDVRDELISWYKRHGYVDTGIRQPFEEDNVSGTHLQPLQFMVLEKQLIL